MVFLERSYLHFCCVHATPSHLQTCLRQRSREYPVLTFSHGLDYDKPWNRMEPEKSCVPKEGNCSTDQ